MTRQAEDGRNIRRDRNIDRVVEAALELFAEEKGVPSIDEIAARAGLSPRSIYRYFEDAASLYLAVAHCLVQQIQERAHVPAELPDSVHVRAVMLANWRWPMHDGLRNIGDALRPYQEKNKAVGDLRRDGSAFITHQVESYFQPELDRLGPNRDIVLRALRVLWSVETWSVLSFDLEHDQERVSRTVIEATIRLLRD